MVIQLRPPADVEAAAGPVVVAQREVVQLAVAERQRHQLIPLLLRAHR